MSRKSVLRTDVISLDSLIETIIISENVSGYLFLFGLKKDEKQTLSVGKINRPRTCDAVIPFLLFWNPLSS